MGDIVQKYWWIWRDIVQEKRFNEMKDEFDKEIEYAVENFMDSEFWCWNCKYSECEQHRVLKRKCSGITQRGRACHVSATKKRGGKEWCHYHF